MVDLSSIVFGLIFGAASCLLGLRDSAISFHLSVRVTIGNGICVVSGLLGDGGSGLMSAPAVCNEGISFQQVSSISHLSDVSLNSF